VKWTRPDDIKAHIERVWMRGDICRAAVSSGDLFPLTIRFKQPSAKMMLDDLAGTQDWVKAIQAYTKKHNIPLHWQSINHRVLGRQQLPAHIVLEEPQQAARLIGKSEALKQFTMLYRQSIKSLAALEGWLLQYPLKALALADDWSQLLALCTWMQVHPNPRIYLRQVDVPKVDSKFIEQHRKVLAQLFDLILPVFAINDDYTGVSGFARRYGFLDKPAMIRVRPLDADISLLCSDGGQDTVMTGKALARLHQEVCNQIERVFIVENEINYLAFPDIPHALLIFGKGYGFEALEPVQWLHDCAIYYWGDLDTHGFAILNQLRASFPHVQSLLMDQATLMDHKHVWGKEPTQQSKALQRLNQEEQGVYDALRYNSLADQLRLEQERIAFPAVVAAIKQL